MATRRPRWTRLTPPGAGGVAVLASWGPERADALTPLVAAGVAATARPRVVDVVLAGGECVDQAVLVDIAADERVELHVHGSGAVLDAIGSVVEWGEPPPTARLGAAHALLERAVTDGQLDLALEQLERPFASWLASLEACVVERRTREVDAARRRVAHARAVLEPLHVVLCGRQNAGKSTLFNRLLFDERAVTGTLPGLTRDAVRERTELDGYVYELVDTAGEGGVTSDVDRRALDRARAERAEAWRLLVVDGAEGPGPVERDLLGPRTVVVRNKVDRPLAAWPDDVPIDVSLSALEAANAGAIRTAVGRALTLRRGLPPAGRVGGPVPLDDVERGLLANA